MCDLATRKEPDRPRALVTGASSGIGRAYAQRLAVLGYDLILVARREDRLVALANFLRDTFSVEVESVAADLALPSAVHAVADRLEHEPLLSFLVNAAGFGSAVPVAQLDKEVMRSMIDVHVMALIHFTRAVLPGMIARGHGSIINVSSISAYLTNLQGRTLYAASKAFVNSFTEGINQEIRGTGVQAQALCPAYVKTEFRDRMGRTWDLPHEVLTPVDDLVEASLAGLASGEVICIPTLENPELLARATTMRAAIVSSAASTGTLASRYRLQCTDRRGT